MSSHWESIVLTARHIDRAFADGRAPELALMATLARAVLDFQQSLVGLRQSPLKPPSVRRTEPQPAPAEPDRSVA